MAKQDARIVNALAMLKPLLKCVKDGKFEEVFKRGDFEIFRKEDLEPILDGVIRRLEMDR